MLDHGLLVEKATHKELMSNRAGILILFVSNIGCRQSDGERCVPQRRTVKGLRLWLATAERKLNIKCIK